MTDTHSDVAAHALLLDNDLFFVAKVTGTLKHAGYTIRTVRTAADFASALAAPGAPFAVALVNTAARGVEWPAAIASAREAGVPVIAYGPHVDLETQEAARHAGATRVITNSKLATDLPWIVARTVRRSTGLDESAAQTTAHSVTQDVTHGVTHGERETGNGHPPTSAPTGREA